MARQEFTKSTRKAALLRSGGLCEAVGKWYGLPEGQRCNAPLSYGVEFDHINSDENGGDNSLENCCASCRKCHQYKTASVDIPRAAKTKRLIEKKFNLKPKKKYKWPKRKFGR